MQISNQIFPVASEREINAVCNKYGLDPISSNMKSSKDRFYAMYGVDPVGTLGTTPISGQNQTGFIKVVQDAFENVKDLYSKVPQEVIETVGFVYYLGHQVRILCDSVVEVALPLIRMIGNAADSITDFGNKTSFFAEILPKVQAFSILTVPFSLRSLAQNVSQFAKAIFAGTIGKVFLKGAKAISNLSDISWAVASFMDGLTAFGQVTSEVAKVAAFHLTAIAVVFMIPVVFIEGRRLHKLKQFEQKIRLSEEKGLEHAITSVSEERKEVLERRLGVSDGGLVKIQLNQIAKLNDQNVIAETLKALKARLVLCKLSQALKITAAIISIIAGTILLFVPAAPLGFALTAIVSVIVISNLIMDRAASGDLKKKLAKFVPETSEEVKKYLEKKKWKAFGKRTTRRNVYRIIRWQPQSRKAEAQNS